jgi:hypothetical protein
MPVIPLHGTPTYQGEVLLLGWSENNRDGMTVRLALDASDEGAVHPFRALGTGKHGQRFMAVLVPLGDDEAPAPEAPVAPPAPEKSKRGWDELSHAQQAGIVCGEVGFHRWIKVETPDEAAAWVREHCGVTSRRELDTNETAATAWNRLVGRYRDFERYGDMR